MSRLGDWMQTYTGLMFWPMDPLPEDINISDIAHALSNLCRYNGHCESFYSVAQHSVLVSEIVPAKYALEGLLHDAAESYIGDMIRPLKTHLLIYKDIECEIEKCIAQKFKLTYPWPAEVKSADNTLLATEARDLMSTPPVPWDLGGALPLEGEISHTWDPKAAREMFLRRYRVLSGLPDAL